MAAVSIFEVFRDILPEYQIKHQENTGIKLKKDTLQLQSYETTLLNYYKKYLQKLEKMTAPLKKKLGKKLTDSDKKLAEIAIRCMCSLLESHPYFNFSQNIAKMLVPFLNHNLENIRAMICNCCKTIFKNDKRGDISLVVSLITLKHHCHESHMISLWWCFISKYFYIYILCFMYIIFSIFR